MDSYGAPTYSAPKVVELGTLSEQTQAIINKAGVSGDVIVINGNPPIPAPGSSIV